MKLAPSLFLAATAIAILTGCGDPPADSASSTTPQPGQPAAGDGASAAATKAAGEVVAEVKKQSAEALAEVQKQAQATYANLSQQLVASAKSGADELYNNISSELGTRVQKLGESLQNNEALSQQLSSAVKSLLGNQDGEAVSGFGDLSAAKLTPEQSTLAKDVYNAAAALVTQRNFSSLEGLNSDVAQVANSVLNGNYSEALPPLQKIYSQATLSPGQKELLGKMYDDYLPADWKESAAKLQQGLDSLKKLGQ